MMRRRLDLLDLGLLDLGLLDLHRQLHLHHVQRTAVGPSVNHILPDVSTIGTHPLVSQNVYQLVKLSPQHRHVVRTLRLSFVNKTMTGVTGTRTISPGQRAFRCRHLSQAHHRLVCAVFEQRRKMTTSFKI